MLAFTLALLAGFSPPDSLPVRPIRQLVHTTWSEQQGAPTGTHVLAQTTDGYLWLGSAFGLVRFDGVQFVPFVPRGNDSLPDIGIRDLLGSDDGSLWIVWESGAVSHMVTGRLTNYGVREGLSPVFQLTESSRGDLVAGTQAGLAQFVNGEWTDVGSAWGFGGTMGRAVWFDRQDALWVESADRVVYRPAGGPGFLDSGMRLSQVAWQADFDEAPDGTVWMAELGRSVHTLRRVGEDLPRTEVQVGAFTVLIDRRGALWIGSRGDGLRRVPNPSLIRGRSIAQFGTEAEQFTEQDGLLSNVVSDLLEDREGNIWVASDRGLERFREGSLLPYTTPGGLRPRTVFASRDSSVWISAYTVQEVTRIGPHGRDDLHEPPCWCSWMAQDSAGGIWAFSDTSIVRFQGLTPSKVNFTGGRLLGIEAIAIDPSGTIWISDRGAGLYRVVGTRLELVVPSRELGRATALMSDRQGRIWAGAGSRVVLYDHGKLTRFGVDEGIQSGQITDVYEDGAGRIWAVGSSGIHTFEAGRFRGLTQRQGVSGRAVFAMREDLSGAWWLAGRTGLLRLAPGELERALADTGHALQYRTYDRLDGLPGGIGVSKLPTLARSLDGRIWVAADEGVAVVDPHDVGRYDVTLTTLVEAVRIDGRELLPSEITVLPPGSHALEIDYTTTALSMAERVRFRYRLEGVDPGWNEVGTRRQAYYTDVRPGSYRFLVSASNGDGTWTDAANGWSFQVLPAWYQTRWFAVLGVLLIGGLAGAVVSLVQRRRHARTQAELIRQHEITLAERIRIAQDLHDTLLQGFAGITLQLKSAELALPDRPDVAVETIFRVQALAEQSLREARERVWDMHGPVAGEADLWTALEMIAWDRTVGMPTEVAVTTAGSPRRLPPMLEDAALRIGREAIVNAVRHAGASRIEIRLDYGPGSFCLEVQDDGCGFTAIKAEEARTRGHFGLSGMRDRATRLHGRIEVRPRPGGGSVVALELPLTP